MVRSRTTRAIASARVVKTSRGLLSVARVEHVESQRRQEHPQGTAHAMVVVHDENGAASALRFESPLRDHPRGYRDGVDQ